MFINNFDPVAFQVFSFEIRWYSLSYIFGIIFGLNTLIGSAIIILTSLYILRREAKVKKGKEPNLEEI